MACPSAQQLRRFLNDELEGDEHSNLVSHASGCATCQLEMEELTSGGTRVVASLLATELGLRELIGRLRERPVDAWSAAAESVRFAGPVSEGAPLGWLGAYQIEAELGAGTTGQVFAARDSRLGRRVAIKLLRPQWASHAEARSRFEREARAVAALEDERIVKVFEVGATSDGAPFMVMEFVDGESLDAKLGRERTLPPREAASITQQIALGLSAAHRRGIVHRDIKPSNVLLVRDEGRGARGEEDAPTSAWPSPLAPSPSPLKLADFGLARVLESTEQLTQEGFIAGTPAYMSPEQIRRPQEADARSDVYSVGVLLYEMLTGERPFRGVLRMVLSQALHEEPVPLRRLNDRIPRDLETICLKAMSKEPTRRYATASELAEDLSRWLTGQPVLARPIGPFGRAWRWCRRNPKLAALNTVVVVVLLAGAFDVARYAVPPEHWPREVAAARHDADRWRNEAEQSRFGLQRLAQELVFESQDSDGRAALQMVLRRLDDIRAETRDESVWQTIFVGHRRLGDLLRQNAELPDAVRHYQTAIQTLRELARLQPARREWMLEIALLEIRSAEVWRQRDSESDVERSVAECVICLDVAEHAARDPAESSAVAQSRNRVAEALTRLGRSDEARRQLRSACRSLGIMASRPESSTRQLREALTATGRLANDLLEGSDLADAHAILEPATAWAERLRGAADVTFADEQAGVLLLRNLAVVELRLERRTDAERRLKDVDRILSRLEADDRSAGQPDWRDWITSQRRELADLQAAIHRK